MEAALNELVPVEYHADAVMLFDVIYDKKNAVFGTIFEVQLERKDRKRYTWPLYAVAARARYECPFVVTAVTPVWSFDAETTWRPSDVTAHAVTWLVWP